MNLLLLFGGVRAQAPWTHRKRPREQIGSVKRAAHSPPARHRKKKSGNQIQLGCISLTASRADAPSRGNFREPGQALGAYFARMRCSVRRCMRSRRAVSETL